MLYRTQSLSGGRLADPENLCLEGLDCGSINQPDSDGAVWAGRVKLGLLMSQMNPLPNGAHLDVRQMLNVGRQVHIVVRYYSPMPHLIDPKAGLKGGHLWWGNGEEASSAGS